MSEKVLVRLINTFKPDRIDWMGDIISEDNPLTFHHIVKKENKGRKTLDNGALLTKRSHKYLHCVLESQDIDTFNALNDEFKQLNRTKQPPTADYYFEVCTILGGRRMTNEKDEIHKKKLTKR